MLKLKLWYYRNFCIISNDKAKELGLCHVANVYGDWINILNCRSIWVDSDYKTYKVKGLNYEYV